MYLLFIIKTMKLIYHPRELEERSRKLELQEIDMFVKKTNIEMREAKIKVISKNINIVAFGCLGVGFFAGFLAGLIL